LLQTGVAPKLLISMSTPCRLKMPVRAPISAGTKENASRPAFPTRSVSAEAEARAPPNKTAEAKRSAQSWCHALQLGRRAGSDGDWVT
jgi:hypothetical protein